jgi:metallo-beta-lactamase class B
MILLGGMVNFYRKAVFGLLCAAASMFAQQGDKPFPEHHIIGNVYYVGSTDNASYLITTPSGNILINSSFESTVPWIRANVEKLGFRFQDTKILLTSHAHSDHVAGNFLVQELTGAKAMVMRGDEDLVRSGGQNDFQYGNTSTFKPSRVDQVLSDGQEVKLGGAILTAHLTPGHTRGCTTWTMKVQEGGKDYDVVIVGSPNVNPGYRLVQNSKYPNIAPDFAHTFEVLKSLHCDVFLGAHGAYYGMEEKYKRLKAGGAKNPFIDPDGYKAYVADRESAYRTELERQRNAAQGGH